MKNVIKIIKYLKVRRFVISLTTSRRLSFRFWWNQKMNDYIECFVGDCLKLSHETKGIKVPSVIEMLLSIVLESQQW